MKIRPWKPEIVVRLSLGFALVWASVGAGQARAQDRPGSDEQFQQLIRSVRGPDLFRAYCASCHGADGKGDGPAARALKVRPADLTLLAKNNRGQFPSNRVRRTIMGEEALAAHGSREMPIWGPIFHQIESDVDRGNVRLENLAKYLESIQTLPPGDRVKNVSGAAENPPSGALLYKQHCAACHGNDLKGNGPAPYPFQGVPPDLTTLARRNHGKFPDAYVSDVLRNGVKMPAHGPAEMPIWGTDFVAGERLDATQVTLRIKNLSNYIKSVQSK